MNRSLYSLAVFASLTGFAADFNRDVRPILSDRCYACHGPDAAARKIKLRLDREEDARQAIESGELLRRISSNDPARRMPPVFTGAKLSDPEVKLIGEWVSEGAKWQKHWSLIPPVRPALPALKAGWNVQNPIDRFVLARLDREGLAASKEAGKATLIRRATLDLTGLPPTPAEVDAFAKDTSPEAYERLLDRLLASPRYGERMAARWLDAARYADTNGYQTDAERVMWRWRDWVIEAFNRNQPFDQFATEQIAGDLLPNATLSQRIATGFNRNHRGNSEGGIVPEEYLNEYAVDRVETTSTVFLGLTVGCARCHNHKYDPILQRDFYQFVAYFNSIPEIGRYLKYGNSPPYVKAPTPDQERQLKTLDDRWKAAAGRFEARMPEIERQQLAWHKTLTLTADWAVREGLAFEAALNESTSGKVGGAAHFNGSRVETLGEQADYGFYDKFTVALWMRPEAATGAIVTRAVDKTDDEGWSVYLENSKLQVNLIKRRLDDSIRLETVRALPVGQWQHVAISYDGSRLASGVKIFINGRPEPVSIILDAINQDFRAKAPLRLGAGGYLEAKFRGDLDELRIYGRAVTDEEAAILATSRTLGELARATLRSTAEAAKLRAAFLDIAASTEIRQAAKDAHQAQLDYATYLESVPTVMVMEEAAAPKPTFVLDRGSYDRPRDPVERGVPGALHPLPAGAPANRLGLAQWITSRENPLTARVTVNRFWQMYFSTGLVKTVEDFGSQGEWPANLDLLDWLATEFVESGWDVKKLQKTILLSATYRQQSNVTPEMESRDPENRLLARGPRYRLPAEMLRDQALAAAGLLSSRIGGPSVKPYQPLDLWAELGDKDYERDKGEGLYRRSLYTFWKRTSAPPFMSTFDSALRESCTVRESRTNTPLQALNLMNDVTFLEAARVLAEKAMLAAAGDARIDEIYLRVLGRKATAAERATLKKSLAYYQDRFQTDPRLAKELLAQGDAPRNASLAAPEHAAYMAVASLVLNLDEALSKE